MPSNQFRSAFVRGLEYNTNWPLVFFNNKQKVFVDRTTPQGQKLLRDIVSEKALYPDDFSRNLIIAHNMFLFGKGEAAKQRAFDFAVKAFELNPSQIPMREAIFATKFAGLRPQVNKFCKSYFDDFIKNKNLYAKQDNYNNRIVAALLAGDYLEKIAREQKDTELVKFYAVKEQEHKDEREKVLKEKRW